jgi:hypothetical protein
MDAEVIYNIDLDICEGIDLMIIKNNTFYALNLFTDTKRARMGRERKEYRHIPFENVNYIEFPINLSNCLKYGQFFLFDRPEYEHLMKILDFPGDNRAFLT